MCEAPSYVPEIQKLKSQGVLNELASSLGVKFVFLSGF